MKIRDGHAVISGDNTEYEMPSGSCDIIADDGRTLFSFKLEDDGGVYVSAGGCCKHNDAVLDDGPLHILPRASNSIIIQRPKI